MGNYWSNTNAAAGRKRSNSQAQLDDADESDVQRTPKRRKLKSTSEYIYQTLFVKGDNSDVTICALGREWKLHKIYLCQSGFFSSMFNGSWKESLMNRIQLDIPDDFVTEESLSIAFGSLYHDEIVIDPCTVASLLAAASLLNLDDLLQQCAGVMRESIDLGTVCVFYAAGLLYGAKDVPEMCVKYLQTTLMPNITVQLLKDINPEFMVKLVAGGELFVLQVEMDVYSMLRKWLFLKLNPSYEGSMKDLIQDTDTFIKLQVANWKPSFLESQDGEPYVQVFSKLRIEYIVTDLSSAKILETDGVLPIVWVRNCYQRQWHQLLMIDNGQDIGPKDLDVETFENRSLRCGRKLDKEGQYCWRWTGFNYGVDILVSCLSHRIFLKRNVASANCHGVVQQQARRHLMYRLTVATASSVTDDQPSVTQTTGIKHLSLRKDEEVCILKVDPKITFPLYISCNFLIYNPLPTTPIEIPVASFVAAAIDDHQPSLGPSDQNDTAMNTAMNY